jgi:hypothetical protein
MTANRFHQIFELESTAIAKRREKYKRPRINLEQEDKERDGTPIMRPAPGSNVIGLALSGGGIRSSAFCLGAMQALNAAGIIDKVDYLSTVSGGGYIGTSMTAAMTRGKPAGCFPFASELRKNEPPGLQHIRDHSNYLFPQGLLNIFSNVVVYLRGLAANVVILLPWLLLAAAFTVYSNPNVEALTKANFAGVLVDLPISIAHFGLTLNGILAFAILLALWALWRSTPAGRGHPDVGFAARSFGVLLIVVLGVAFCELQPAVLAGMFKTGSGEFSARAYSSLKSAAQFLVSIGAALGFLGRFLGDALKRSTDKPGFSAFAARIAIKFAMYLAGIAVPLALWLAYLYLSFWGIQINAATADAPMVPGWLETLAGMPFIDGRIIVLYLISGVVLFLISWLFDPNANSLHRLYRDRLSKAFLFNPSQRTTVSAFPFLKQQTGAVSAVQLRNADLEPLDDLKISGLSTTEAPYHLINAALNIEGSKYTNRRGRNADFFIFSPLFSGSEATGYVQTSQMEGKMKGFTAASAMATSGAAASSNMGSATIKPLVPTLAILNIRLGYWIINPAAVAGTLKKSLLGRLYDKAFFLNELLGLLREDSGTVYLTDGGHLENLGIYELLRRRCKLIIAVDAEADPDLSFGSLITLERYARIDFGVRIDLPWAAIRDANRDASAEILKSGGLPFNKTPHGPHCALGTIHYPQKAGDSESRTTGVLLYIKSSCTGDENDYVIDYKRRNSSFPHETTMDQLFTEEQFEVYRALGFHAVDSAFECVDEVSMSPKPVIWQGPASTMPLEQLMRSVLAGSCPH